MTLTATPFGTEVLHGKRLVLEMLNASHAEFLAQTYKLDGFMDCYRLAQDRELSLEQIQQRLEREKGYSPQQLRRIEWVIKLLPRHAGEQEQAIGLASLADYQSAHNRAELLIGINRSEDRISGLAMEATLLVLEFAFQQVKLHKMISFVYAFNKVAQKNTLHLGFVQEALLREHYFNYRTGQFIDLYQNCLLQKNFFANKKLSRWSKRLLGRDITIEKHYPSVKAMSQEQMKKGLGNIIKQATTLKQ
jgi:RimJ/RimL family protein N-acetyltransferase